MDVSDKAFKCKPVRYAEPRLINRLPSFFGDYVNKALLGATGLQRESSARR